MSCNEYISLVLFAGDDIARLEKCLCSILDYSPYQGYEMIVVEATNDVVMDAYLRKLPNIRLVARKTVKSDDMLEALCKELLQLRTVSVAEEDLMNFQIICRAEK